MAMESKAFNELRLLGQAYFETGQAASAWEGLGRASRERPDLVEQFIKDKIADEALRIGTAATTKSLSATRSTSMSTRPVPLTYGERQRLAKVQKQADPAPPRSATDVLMDRIAQRQADHPELSFVEASNLVRKEQPELYDQYAWESRHPHLPPRPVAKQTPPVLTPEAVLKTARAHAAAHGTRCRDELLTMVKEQQGTPHFAAVYQAYTRYHTGQGVDDWYEERIGTGQAS
jgi:hypothetical protein